MGPNWQDRTLPLLRGWPRRVRSAVVHAISLAHASLTGPTALGFWASWVPFALPQVWPFCWWVGVRPLLQPVAASPLPAEECPDPAER